MKQKILFVHSAGAQGPEEGSTMLVQYLREQLGSKYEVFGPLLPEPENPRYESWKNMLKEILCAQDDQLLLVGHSLGGSVLLKVLSEELPEKKIKGLFLVATPYWGKKDWEIEEFMFQADFTELLSSISQIFLYHSRNDGFVPFSHMDHLAEEFPNATVRSLEGSEHEFFYGLPELVNDIKNLK